MNIFSANQKGFAPLLIITGLLVLGIAVGGAYFLGTRQTARTTPLSVPSPSPFLEANPMPNIPQISEVKSIPKPQPSLPSANTPATSLVPAAENSVVIPADWKSYSVDDIDFKVRTTMSLPPELSFEGTYGWVFHIFNNGSSEDWDHKTSITRTLDNIVKNRYDGSSRRAWYQKNNLDPINAKITSVEEYPIGSSSTYLKLKVEEQGQVNTHYLYVENGIVHILVSQGSSENPQLPKVLDKVFYTMKSTRIN